MNYAGKFDATFATDGSGLVPDAHRHVETVTAHATHTPAGAIIVPDAQLLFNGDFKRAGVDLILSGDDRELVLHDYFKGEKRAALASPDGAHLTGDIVDALTGHTEYAQADGSTSAGHVIGHVTKLVGSATAIRNGVSIILNMGDNVEKGDVVQSGSDSTVGITFIDGTVFGLSSNAKMVLNEMVYDPNGSNNSSLISLVAGTISFVAGETAKHGDMKVDTPVATMGIRGTAVLVEIDFSVPGQGGAPDAKFQVLVEPDGHTGSYILFDKTTLAPIATVNQAGQQINISQGQISITNAPLPPDIQKLIIDVFTLKFTDANPQQNQHFTDTIVPQTPQTITLANGTSATAFAIKVNTDSGAQVTAQGGPTNSVVHIPGPPQAVILDASGHPITGVSFSELAGKTGDYADLDGTTVKINFVDVNAGDTPTVSQQFISFSYQNAAHQDVTASLNTQQLADIAAVEAQLTLTPNPDNNNNGSTLVTYSVPDGAFDFLAAGETLQLTYTLTVSTNYASDNEKTPLTFTIIITGTNDQPIITTDQQIQLIEYAAGTTTTGGPLQTLHNEVTSGTFAFTDVDLTDTHTVSVALTAASLPGSGGTLDKAALEALAPGPMQAFEQALSVAIASDSTGSSYGTISWQLAALPVYLADFIPAGEKLTLDYTITLTDSQGATDTKTIEVTITGTNSPAVVWIHTTDDGQDNNWTTAPDWETGTVPTSGNDVIIVTNQLHPHTPSYPANITAGTAAQAHSVTLNDFVGLPPELDIQKGGSLAIGGGLNLSADSILRNFGDLSLGGLAEILNNSVLQNTGTMTLADGGDFRDQSTITNSGTIEVSGGTLNVKVNVANGGGNLNIDGGAKLVLDGAKIDTGTVTNKAGGEIDLVGAAVLSNGSLGNSGLIKVTGTGNALDGETVTANNALEVTAGAALLIDPSTIDNTGGTITIDSTGALTLNGSTVTAGFVDDEGTLALTGLAAIQNGTLTNNGIFTVSGAGNALDTEQVTNNATLEVIGALTIDQNSLVTNGGAADGITIDSTGALTLNGSTVTAGFVDDEGTLALTGLAAIQNGTLTNNGIFTVSGAGNALDTEQVTNNATLEVIGALTIDQNSLVTNGGAADGITIDSTGALTLNGSTVTAGFVDDEGTLALTGLAAIQNGTLTNNGIFTVSGAGNALDTEQVTNNATLEVIGALTIDQNSLVTNGGAADGITIDSTGALTLNGSTVTAGTVTNDAGGEFDLTGNAVLQSGALGNADQINVSGSGNQLLGETVTNTGNIDVSGALLVDPSSIDNTGGGSITVENTGTLTVNGTTVAAGTVTDNGTIDVTGNSTIDSSISLLGGLIKVEDNTTLMLGDALAIGASTVTLVGAHAILDNSAGLSLAGGSITGSGDLAADTNLTGCGTVSIPLDVADLVMASGGTLEFTNAVDGTAATSLEIAAATGSVLKFDAAVGTASVTPTITFIGSDDGAGVLDLTAISLSNFHGVIANFDEGEAIDIHNAASATLDGTGQILTVFDASHNTLGTIDLATSYAGDTFNVSGGAITVDDLAVTLDNATATEGTTIHVTAVTDDGASLASGVTYSWQTLDVNGNWNQVGSGSSYAPTETDEGHSLKLVTTYAADPSGSESKTVNFGVVQESPTENASIVLSGLTSGNAVEGQQITATVSEPDAPASGITYTWTVGNTVVHSGSDAAGATYTPTENHEGQAISVAVSFNDTHGFAETGTTSAGTVQEITGGDLEATLSSNTPLQGASISVATVTDGGVTVALTDPHLSYQWKVNGVNAGGSGATTSTYTPTEADEGKALSVMVTDSSDPSSNDVATATASSAVGEIAGGDLVATLDSTTAQQGVTMHVLGVKDGGITVTTGLSYAWQDSTNNGTWTTVGTNSSYTPGESDEGNLMQLVVTYVDAGGKESSIYALGMSNDLVATADSATAKQGSTIHVTGVKDGGTSVSTGLSYAWQVSADNGHTWNPVGTNSNSYTPTVTDAGQLLEVVVTYVDSGEHESATDSFGIVAPSTVTITVLTPNGLDFQHHNALVEMGSGTIQAGGNSTSFTIVDTADNLKFVVNGSNFTYGSGAGGITVTGGTLTSFHEFANDSAAVALANFSGISVDAATWMVDVQLAAGGNQSAIEALTSKFAFNFVGGPGPDSFGSAGQADTLTGTGKDFFDGGGAPAGSHDTLTGGAGSTFVFQQGYGALTITNFDQANGTFDKTEGDQIQLNGLTAPRLNVTYSGGNTTLDFGNGDVITLLNVIPDTISIA